MEETKSKLRRLGWSAAANNIDLRNQQAISEEMPYSVFLELLMEDEVAYRRSKDYDNRLKTSRLDPMMVLDNYDFTFNPGINKKEIYSFATCDFILNRKSIVFHGFSGTGKTHLANALGIEALRKDYSVLFITMQELVANVKLSLIKGALYWESLLRKYLKPELLILDEVGLEPIPYDVWGQLYQIINGRYKKQQSLIMTSNRAFSKWAELFIMETKEGTEKNDLVLPSALIQRMVHKAHLVKVEGRSYRLKDFTLSEETERIKTDKK
jgi:DNA replication protein DnaC